MKTIKLSGMCLLTVSLCLSACKAQATKTTEAIETTQAEEIVEVTEETELLGITSMAETPPEPLYMKPENFKEQEKNFFGDDYELYNSYANNKEFSQELYDKVLASEKLFEEMKVHGNVKFDTDRDGLTDYEEIEIYGTNPDKKSTSGDLYSDGYKVLKDMDVTKYYENDWIKIDDNLSILNEGYISDDFHYSLEENHLKVKGLTYFSLYGYSGFQALSHSPIYMLSFGVKIDQGFYGDVKLSLNQSLDNITIEEYDIVDNTLTPIEFTIDEDNRLCFHYERFSSYLLIYDKEKKTKVEKALKKEYE